jgi:hypothetical protein
MQGQWIIGADAHKGGFILFSLSGKSLIDDFLTNKLVEISSLWLSLKSITELRQWRIELSFSMVYTVLLSWDTIVE